MRCAIGRRPKWQSFNLLPSPWLNSLTTAAACLLPSQITRGLLQKYGADRVRDTPITEVRGSFPDQDRALLMFSTLAQMLERRFSHQAYSWEDVLLGPGLAMLGA